MYIQQRKSSCAKIGPGQKIDEHMYQQKSLFFQLKETTYASDTKHPCRHSKDFHMLAHFDLTVDKDQCLSFTRD